MTKAQKHEKTRPGGDESLATLECGVEKPHRKVKKNKSKKGELSNGGVEVETTAETKKTHSNAEAMNGFGEQPRFRSSKKKTKKKEKRKEGEKVEEGNEEVGNLREDVGVYVEAKTKKKKKKRSKIEAEDATPCSHNKKKKNKKKEHVNEKPTVISSSDPPIENDDVVLLNVVSVEARPPEKEEKRENGPTKNEENWEVFVGTNRNADGENEKLENGSTRLRLRFAKFGKPPPWQSRRNAEAVSAAKKSYKHLIKGDIVVDFKNTNLHAIRGYAVTKKTPSQALSEIF